MKNKKYVFKTALMTCLGSVLAASAVMTAPAIGVNATALTNGPIHYSEGAGATSKSFNMDGTSATLPSFLTGLPFYSNDGTKVAWIKVDLGTSKSEVYVANADGTDTKKLLTATGTFDKPQFSADKSKLYFFTPSGGEIYSVDTSIENQSLGNPLVDESGMFDFSISASGKIAHVQMSPSLGQGTCSSVFGVVTRDADGQNPVTLTGSCDATSGTNTKSVQWNSDGTQLFLGQKIGASTYRVAKIPAAGGSLNVVATFTADPLQMALSPDGTELIVATQQMSPSMTLTLTRMRTDGTGSNVVATNGSIIRIVSWGIPLTTSSTGDGSSSSSGSTGSGGTTSGGTSGTTNNSTTVVPGVTKSDTTVYTRAPQKVAANSAVAVLTKAETKQQTLVSNTPSVCLPTKEDIVFIDEGRCSVSILDKKSGAVLRRFRTTVVEDSVTELNIGNEVAVIAPIFFDGKSTDVNARGMRRLRSLTSRITAAGKVLVVGHSGIALGDTPENRQLSTGRAVSTVRAMKKLGAKGPFISIGVGTKDPLVASTSGVDQSKNRRVVVILVP